MESSLQRKSPDLWNKQTETNRGMLCVDLLLLSSHIITGLRDSLILVVTQFLLREEVLCDDQNDGSEGDWAKTMCTIRARFYSIHLPKRASCV